MKRVGKSAAVGLDFNVPVRSFSSVRGNLRAGDFAGPRVEKKEVDNLEKREVNNLEKRVVDNLGKRVVNN